MKRCLLFVVLLCVVVALSAVRTKVIDEENEFGGQTIKTTYSTGMRYHTEENVRTTIEYHDTSDQIVKVQKYLINGMVGYEYYERGSLRRIEWERPDLTFESIEYFAPDGAIERIEWFCKGEERIIDHVIFYEADLISRIERTPPDEPRVIEHYDAGVLARIDLHRADGTLEYTQHYDERKKLRQRDMFKPDGKLEKEFFFDEKENLIREVWYQRTGKKTVSHFEKRRKVKTEFFDRYDRLEKICYYNKDGAMTHYEKYDATGAIIETRRFELD
ncbi:MAG: hypothetical protein K8R90_03170 [Candidatus Cloacimonetes bacterium]|nr:hypothetical protein [Candidatus Cloacimonadota bacterium]